MIVLIPPSEGKRAGGSGPVIEALPETRELLKRYRAAAKKRRAILGVKGEALEQAHAANLAILESATMSAIERYTGVVYEALDYASLDAKAKRFCDEHVRIVTSMFGLVSPLDPIPDHKLKIEKLEAWKLWKPAMSRALEGEYVIDLLPKAHARAVHYDTGIRVEFFDEHGLAMGHFGKHIKGRFVRWLCEHAVEDPARFGEFDEDGFSWDGERFVRT